ncbi:metal ABC transporter substrate-binding protein [Nocardioides litoris]|uniref:metal ABC transporter substrate-binding protein n=1 Tax=Nocardioides litoris TaxID=1926648 RepID=UPI00111F9109|nr:metal ABC transporter substrate-binding protein [Nocardioides litoris]
MRVTPALRPAALSLASAVVLALGVSGCAAFSDDTASEGSGGSGDGLTVATAFYPLAYVTQRIGGEDVAVENLTQPGQEPHDLELTVGETAEISAADLVVYLRDFQPAVDEAVEQNAAGATLDAGEVVGLEPFADEDHADEHADQHADEHGDEHVGEEPADEPVAATPSEEEGHHEGDGHDHEGDLDPHFWLDPDRMADLGDAVADQLSEIDPERAATYAENADALRADLDDLDDALTDGLSSCERETIVVSHDAFGYLSKYGVEVAPVAGLTPDAEPTVSVLADLQALIREDGITTVFSERLASPAFTESLAEDTGITTAVLDPIEGLTDETSGEDYLSLMRENLEALQKANGCG